MAEVKTTKQKAAAKKPAEAKAEHKKPAQKSEHKKPAAHEKPAHEKPAQDKAQTKSHETHATQSKAKAKVETAPKEEKADKEKPQVKEKPKSKVKERKVKKEVKQEKIFSAVKIKNLPDKSVVGSSKSKPAFHRQEFMRYKKLDQKWRAPTGIDSKKLEKKRGKGNSPSIGYKKPRAESELHWGFRAVRVFNADGLKGINPKTHAAVIASAVGRRKRNMIIEEANKHNITILNPRRGEA